MTDTNIAVCPPSGEEDGSEYLIFPQFVSVTANMRLVDHDGRQA